MVNYPDLSYRFEVGACNCPAALVNVCSKIMNQLVDLGVIVPDTSVVKKGYRYQRIYSHLQI